MWSELKSILPLWLSGPLFAGYCVIYVFWNMDQVISLEARKAFASKLKTLDVSLYRISSIYILEHVFYNLYSRQSGKLPSILKVVLATTCSILLVFVFYITLYTSFSETASHLVQAFQTSYIPFLTLVVLNYVFDYLSVTKALLIIQNLTAANSKIATIKFILMDIFTTIGMGVVFIFLTFMIKTNTNIRYTMQEANVLTAAFLISAFMTVLLSIVFAVSKDIFKTLSSLNNLSPPSSGYSRIWRVLIWLLPVDRKPCRAVGCLASFLVFVLTTSLIFAVS